MTLEEQLRTALKDAGTRIDPEADHSLRPGRPTRRPVIAFAGGVGAVLVAGLAALWLVGGQGGSGPAVTGDRMEWTAVDALPPDYVITGLAEGRNGWIAIAPRHVGGGFGEHVVLQSDDGVEWSLLEDVVLPAVVTVGNVMTDEDGYVAYGLHAGANYTVTTKDKPSNFAEPAVWTSPDGVIWTVHPLPLPTASEAISAVVSYRIGGLAVEGDEMIAVGTEFDEDLPDIEGEVVVPTRPVMWRAERSGEWELIAPEGLIDFNDVASGPGGIVAVGPGSGSAGFVWDGSVWMELGSLPTGFWYTIDGGADGYVVLADNSTIHVSENGDEWTPAVGPGRTSTIWAGEDAFAAVSAEGDDALVWRSDDGAVWEPVSTVEGIGADYVHGVRLVEDRVLLYGQVFGAIDGPDARGYLLIGEPK